MKNKNVFFKLMHFIGKYRFVLIVSILLAMFSVILQLYVPVLFGDAIDEIVSIGNVNFASLGQYLSKIIFCVLLSVYGL